MELRHLRYFIATAEEENFSLAADRLCVTRPAVSQLVTNLEEELGTQLFERLPRGVRLTPAGSVYLQRLQRIFGELAQAGEIVKRVGSGKAALLNVGYGSSTLHHPVFRGAIKETHVHHPEIALSLFEGSSVEQLQTLRAGTLQLRFTHTVMADDSASAQQQHDRIGQIETDPELNRLLIQFGQVSVALHAGHPLAAKNKLRLADLAQEGFIIAAPQSTISPIYGRLAALCHDAGFEARVVQHVRNTATQLDLVSVGIGIGLLITLPGISFGRDLIIRPLSDINFSTRFELVWLHGHASGTAVNIFVDTVRRLTIEHWQNIQRSGR